MRYLAIPTEKPGSVIHGGATWASLTSGALLSVGLWAIFKGARQDFHALAWFGIGSSLCAVVLHVFGSNRSIHWEQQGIRLAHSGLFRGHDRTVRHDQIESVSWNRGSEPWFNGVDLSMEVEGEGSVYLMSLIKCTDEVADRYTELLANVPEDIGTIAADRFGR